MKKRKTLYSFDIFDTLITRAVVKPSDIHSIVQQKILSDVRFSNVNSYFKHDFSIIRKEYENYCRENSMLNDNGYDISLNDIYKEIQINYNLPENITNEIKSIEIKTEYNNILPIDKNIKKLKELLKNGEKVILISDMYLDSNTIRSFLLKVDNIFQNIEIYVSSEYKKSKYNGSLYRMIKNKYNKYNNFIHYGDNKFSDILQAKWNKIQPIKIKPIALKPVEKYLSEKYNNIEILLPIGVSRYLREQCSTSDTYNFGVSIAAPFLYNYVDWILHDAINRGFKHLYFVARDGYILKLIADEIIKIQNFNIQTHYFYSSRRVTRIPNKNNI